MNESTRKGNKKNVMFTTVGDNTTISLRIWHITNKTYHMGRRLRCLVLLLGIFPNLPNNIILSQVTLYYNIRLIIPRRNHEKTVFIKVTFIFILLFYGTDNVDDCVCLSVCVN